jgi:hypothetical protein
MRERESQEHTKHVNVKIPMLLVHNRLQCDPQELEDALSELLHRGYVERCLEHEDCVEVVTSAALMEQDDE